MGSPPFEAEDHQKTYDRIKRIDLKFPEFVSREARDFIQNILIYDPKQRLTLEQIERHPWIQKYATRNNA